MRWFIFAFACVSAASAGTGQHAAAIDSAAPGPVYVDGMQIAPPFTFTGVDTDTLRLNGNVYDAIWRSGDPTPPVTVTPLSQAKYDLSLAALDFAKSGSTHAQRRALFAAAYRDSPLVLDVLEFEWGLQVHWADKPNDLYVIRLPEEIFLPEEMKSELDVAAFHQRLIDEFFATINRGGLVAFGTPPRRYHFTMPPASMPQFDRELAKIKAGESLTPIDIKHTALNPQFLEDLIRVQSGVR